MREQNPSHFCALALCAVCENKLSNRDLGPDSSNRDKVDWVMELLGMNRMTAQKGVSNAMDALNGVYFTRNGKSYTFLHSLFEDIVTFILGEESTVFLFKYCSSTFLRSHVKIVDTRANAGEHVIMLERSEYKDLAERMCQELRKNNIEDIFYHSALGNKHFLKIFMNECSKDKIVEYANEMNIPLLAWSCRVEMFRLTLALLKEGAALNICDETKRSALMWVCRNNFRAKDQICDIAKRLLNAGADARLIDNRNYNALLYAIRKGDVHIVRDLLAHGACVKEVSSKLSPLSMAVKSALKHKRTHFESAPGQNQSDQYSTKIVTLLLEHGADPNFGDAGDKTMLYQSVSHSNIAISKCLLQHGADVGLSNTLNEDLLCCAISNCSLELVELLLDKNVSVNNHDGFSKSPLHLAVIKDNSDLVTLLIKRGACVNSKDSGR
ncbi:ankyrin repeat domain-containing protein 50-like [Pecten maximus]|uniref:ankyrin repeat domain-containing protein 50-like n=1 Tax=Pecten maximus TaxID=6579 RepID=UPI001458F459|nr:ankyrin repeat domain-containing protein 50-like [Pecten maximus]